MAEAATLLTDETPAAEGQETETPVQDPAGEQNSGAEGKPEGQETGDPAGKQGDSGEEGTDDAPGDEGDEKSADVPEKYELEFPDGVEPDAKLLEEVTPIFKELGLTNEQAQKLTAAYANRYQETMEAHAAQVVEWANQVKADKEIGGAKFDASVQTAQAAIRQYADADVIELLNTTGLGNHPAVVKMFYRIGQTLGEDTHVPAGSGTHQRTSLAERWYPNHPKE